ncbi:hypothetical protein GCM10010343_37830 [Streptomyces avidinii]|nr:hypothetical protein GCM10010343_37830 [Streptomyces avidinii]
MPLAVVPVEAEDGDVVGVAAGVQGLCLPDEAIGECEQCFDFQAAGGGAVVSFGVEGRGTGRREREGRRLSVLQSWGDAQGDDVCGAQFVGAFVRVR